MVFGVTSIRMVAEIAFLYVLWKETIINEGYSFISLDEFEG